MTITAGRSRRRPRRENGASSGGCARIQASRHVREWLSRGRAEGSVPDDPGNVRSALEGVPEMIGWAAGGGYFGVGTKKKPGYRVLNSSGLKSKQRINTLPVPAHPSRRRHLSCDQMIGGVEIG